MRQYTVSFTGRNREFITQMPNWFERVILRRKPKTIFVDEIAAKLAAKARANEAELLRSLFEDGRIDRHGKETRSGG